jgi:hypothetical protein
MPLFKSKFEKTVWDKLKQVFSACKYEPKKYSYIQPAIQRTYIPDFKPGTAEIYIEAKGKLDLETRKKMVWFKQCNPKTRIIFLFMNPDVKIRKGSKTTYWMWAEDNGFEWLDARKDWISDYKKLCKKK